MSCIISAVLIVDIAPVTNQTFLEGFQSEVCLSYSSILAKDVIILISVDFNTASGTALVNLKLF